MRLHIKGMMLASCVLAATAVMAQSQEAGHAEGQPVPKNANHLSRREQREGWKLLFDGKSTNGWRNFKKQDISKGWQVIDGALCRMDSTAGDIVTV